MGVGDGQGGLACCNSWGREESDTTERPIFEPPSHLPSHLTLCHPLFLLPTIPPSIRVFSSESTLLMRWPKYWSFSFSIIPSKEHPGLISFRMDWLDLLAVQGTLKSLLQHHSSKASDSKYFRLCRPRGQTEDTVLELLIFTLLINTCLEIQKLF